MKRNLTLKHLDFRTRLHRFRFFMLFMTLTLFSVVGNAQVVNYSFAQSAGTYTEITGGTAVVTCTDCGIAYDSNTFPVTLPSSFPFNGNNITAITFCVDGSLVLGTTSGNSATGPLASGQTATGVISALGMDLRNTTITGQTYELRWQDVGTEYVFQWKNASRWAQNTAERFSFQIRINKTTGVIQFVYDAPVTPASSTTYQPVVGLRGTANTDYISRQLTTTVPTSTPTWTNTAASTSNSQTVRFTSGSPAATPAAGQTYTWTPPPPCVTPSSQPTALVSTPASTTIGGSFTAASPVADRYLVVRTTGAAPTNPVNGTNYTTGTGLGGNIVSVGTTTTFSSTGLTGNTSYTHYVFAYNNVCSGGPFYNTASPLTGTSITCPAVPGSPTTTGVTTSGFNINWTSSLGGGAASVTYTVEVATDNAFANQVTGSPFTVAHPTLTQPVTGLNPITTYYYRIKAANGCSSAYTTTGTVTTLCNSVTVPTALEPFGTAATPTCWSTALVSGTTGWASFAGNSGDITGPYAGTHFMEKNYTSSNALLFSMPLNYTSVTVPTQVNVWMHRHASAAAADRYRVFVNTTQSLTGATQILELFSKTTTAPAVPATGWYNYQIPIPASFNGQPIVFIIFQGTTNDGLNSYDLGIDNFVVEPVPTCLPATGLTLGTVSTNTANFSWTAPATGTPLSYKWKVVANGAGAGAVAVDSGTTTHPTVMASASGLTPNTAYQVYVRTDCGAGDVAVWTTPVAFTTPCLASNIPYIMPITGVTSPALPSCTSVQNVNNDNKTWRSYSSADMTYNGWTYPVMGYQYNSSNAANDWLYTQGLNLTGGVSYRLTFKYNNDNSLSWTEKLRVKYGNMAIADSMTHLLADYPSILNTTPQSAVIDFTPTTTGIYYIGFQAYSVANQNVLLLDDIMVELTPTCFPPTALTVAGYGSNSVNVSWTAPTQGTPANYIWKAVASGAGVNGATVSTGTVAHPTLNATVNGLNPTTNYDVYVRTECGGGDSSTWAGPLAVVTTQVPVTVFPYTNTFESGLDGWQTTSGSQVNKWVLGTAVNNGGTQSLYISKDTGTTNTYTITTASVVHAYRDFQLPAGFPLIQLAFDWRSMGDAAVDRMRVWVVPSNFTPVAGTQITATGTAPNGRIQLGGNFSDQSTFDTANFVLPLAYQNQTFRLVFEWRNNASAGTQPPAAIDNINMVLGTCSTPSTLAATTTPTSASLSWTETGVATMWDIEYGPAGFTPGTGTMLNDVTTNNPYVLSPLNPSTTYSFYVRGDCGGSQSPWGGPFNFQTPCLPLNITGTTPGTRCGVGTVTLGATGDAGAELNWYAASTGGASLGMGTSFTTPSISTTTNYYVSASTIGLGNIPVGAGANTGTGVAYNPTQGGYGGLKGQYLFTAAELSAAGLKAGNITALALDITSAGATLDSFAVQMGTTALTTFPTPVSIVGGLTTVRPYASFVPSVGVNTITFSTPFNWDGTSNIIVSTSWSNNNASNTSSTVKYDNTTNYSSQTYRKDNALASAMFTFTGSTGSGTSTFDRSQNRPRMTFSGNTVTCVSARTPVAATVTTPPAITATVTEDTICAGTSVSLNVSSANAGYSYVWNPGNSTANPYSVSPATTTSYIVTATDNSGGANNGCVANDTVNVVVNPIPAAPVVTPVTANVCIGGTQTLSAASAGNAVPIFSENFEGTVNMTTVNTSTGTAPANAAWTVRNDGYQNTGGTTVFTFHSPNNSKFMLSNSDAVGSGSNVLTQLISPVINTTGFTGLSLAFDHHFKARLASNGKVDVSVDGGTNWTTVQTYTTTDAGTPDAFAHANLNLNTYVNNPNFRIRFVYTAGWDWFWALDNIVLNGNTPMATSWTASPAGAGLPGSAGTYSASNGSVDVTPSGTGTYTYIATVQSSAGCVSSGDTATITVNALPIVDAGATQTVCPGDTITLSGSGATSYTWNNGVTNNTPFVATTTTLYTVTGTDANGCSAQDTVSVIVNPASPASITASGPLTFCQNETLTLTAGGPALGAATVITQWNFNAGNTTPSTGTGTATLVGGTTATFVQGTGSTDAAIPNSGWNTSDYPVQGTANRSAGVQYNVSTAGYTNVVFSFDVRHSGTAANTYVVQYNPDVTNGLSPWINADTLVYNTSTTFINNQTVNMAGIPAANNNPNLGIRVVSSFAGSSNAYAPTTSASYGTAGTVRYDMVTFTGNPVPYTVVWSPGGQTTYNINPTTTGTYTATITETGVCSGTASVNVTVNPVATTVVYPVICADTSYTLVDGTQVNTTGIYTRTTTAATGCDSIVVVNLTVNPVYNTPVSATICSNDHYTLANGTQVTAAGTYTTVVPSALGCDSTVVVTLSVIPAQSVTVPATICANQTYTLPNGNVVSTSGTYTSTFAAANGCDSIIVTNLTVKPVFTSTQSPVICQGDTHTMPDGSTADTAGTYVFPYTAANGCDSTITVNLTVNPVYITNIVVNICPGQTYTLVDGTVVDTTGTYTAATNSANGCDSTVIAVVTLRPTYAVTVNESICQGDSYTLVNGSTVTTAGTYTSATQSIYGCDSVVTVNLTVKPTYNQTVNASVCQGETYTLPDGTTATTAGTYTSTLSSAGGCDSTITTVLTVNPLPNVNLGNDIVQVNPPVILNAGVGFASYDWSNGAQTQTISVSQNGTYHVTVTNTAGCEASDTVTVYFTASVVKLNENGASISLFPNPANERFAVNVYGYTGGGTMKLDLINAVGQVVVTEVVAASESFSKEMDIATLPSGAYTLRVKGSNAEAALRVIIAR